MSFLDRLGAGIVWIGLAMLPTASLIAEEPATAPATAPASAPAETQESAPSPGFLSAAGGEITIQAGSQTREEGGYYLLEGYVAILGEEGTLQADRVEYDPRTGDCVATGNVVMEGRQTKVTGSRAEWNAKTGLGKIWDATGVSSDDISFTAKMVERRERDLYFLEDAMLTSCVQALPVWNVRFSKGRFREDKFAHLWNPVIRFKKMPAAYSPYVVFPIRKERSTGFLMPQVAYSDRRGVTVANALFWAISRNSDATFELDWYEKTGFEFATEFRYLGRGDAQGTLEAFYTDEEDTDSYGNTTPRRRWEVSYDHAQRFGDFWRWLVNLDYISDFTYTQSIGAASIDSTSRNDTISNTSFTKNAPSYSLTFLAERQEHYFTTTGTGGERTTILANLPKARISSGARRLGKSPVYFSYEASGDAFQTDRPTYTPGGTVDVSTSWQRLYVAPSVRIPLFRRLQWMSLTPRIATREALYTKRRPEDLDPLETESGSFLYSAPFFELEWIGPRMQRFYGLERAPGKRKYKQLIEPRIVWTYEPDLEDQAQILTFDGQDYVFSRPSDPENPGRDLDRNLLFYGFTTRLWSKEVEEEGAPSRASSWEIFSFDLTQSYALNYDQNRWQREPGEDPETSPFSNVLGTIRYRPGRKATLGGSVGWDWLASTVGNWRLAGDWTYGRDRVLSLAWDRTRPVRSTYESNQLRLLWGTRIWGERFRWSMDLAYDIEASILRGQRFLLDYGGQCCGVTLQYYRNEYALGDADQEIRFTVRLKNAGNFVNFHSRGL